MKKIIVLLLVLGTVFGCLRETAQAHVLVTDKSGMNGAVLHIQPDDDPVAGEQATLYFDVQSKYIGQVDLVSMTVQNEAGAYTLVSGSVEGRAAGFLYTFPEQGVYTLTFSVNSVGQDYVFVYTQRVTRGATASVSSRQDFAWAELLLIFSLIGFGVLAVVAFNRRGNIAKQSKFR